MSRSRLRYLVAATALMLMTFPLQANVVLPGDVKAPDVFPDPGNPPVLKDITGTFNFGSGALTGSWEEIVAVDPFGVTCASCLDFAFFISVDQSSTNSLETFGFANVFGYTTDMGYVSGRGVNPDSVNRLPNGNAVGWGFSGLVGPGQSTAALVVATNAHSYDTTGFVAMNVDPDSVSKGRPSGAIRNLFGPVAVPEPSTALFLSLGLVGIAAFRKRTR